MRLSALGISASLLLSSLPSHAAMASDFKQCPQFFAGGVSPQSQRFDSLRSRALCYEAFAVLHSGTTKTPIFSAERLNRAQLLDARGEDRTDKFFADARLPRAERAELDDYKGSGMDRGHLSPAADQPNQVAMAQSFSLANMVPQAPQNNRKTWASIEKATRKYVMRAEGDVFVISGPAYLTPAGEIGAGRVRVPSHLFKLVYDASTGRAWAHWVENTDEARAGRPITYKELVERTGIEFLPGIRVRN